MLTFTHSLTLNSKIRDWQNPLTGNSIQSNQKTDAIMFILNA